MKCLIITDGLENNEYDISKKEYDLKVLLYVKSIGDLFSGIYNIKIPLEEHKYLGRLIDELPITSIDLIVSTNEKFSILTNYLDCKGILYKCVYL